MFYAAFFLGNLTWTPLRASGKPPSPRYCFKLFIVKSVETVINLDFICIDICYQKGVEARSI